MEATIRNKLRRWALFADVIANGQYNHFHRERRIQALILLVQSHKLTDQPLWQKALLDILQHTVQDTNLTHFDIKSALMLFEDACRHLAENGDETWMLWATHVYDAKGNIVWGDVWWEFLGEESSEDEPSDTEDDDTGEDGKIPW
ncbi:MAG: hypothetical protein AAFN11_03405 [Chloroflexota bacterium]